MSFKKFFLLATALSGTASAAIIKILAQADYETPDVFSFVPNDVTGAIGDILEFHFAGTGNGVLGGNHSVAQGVFGNPCMPAANGFFSGFMPVNATSFEADNIFQVRLATSEPIVFFCTVGQHCTRGMYGVVNGVGTRTLKAYHDSIKVNKNAMSPPIVGGGEILPNDVNSILQPRPMIAGADVPSARLGGALLASVFGMALLMA